MRRADRWKDLPSTGVRIAAAAHHLPARVVGNAEIIEAEGLRLKPAWVEENLGIRERRWCAPGETASVLASEVCKRLLERAGVAPASIGRLLLATVSPDVLSPATACIAQSLFAPGATFPCADVVGACSGFLYALDLARRCVQTGEDAVLCVAAETRSLFLDRQDRRTVMLFGDGAGGVLLSRCAPGQVGIVSTQTFADGRHWDAVSVPGGGTRALQPGSDLRAVITMRDAALVLERASQEMAALVRRALEPHGLSPADVDLFVFHQASAAIVRAACAALAIPEERAVLDFDRVGNTTAASVPIALSEAAEGGRLAPGDLVCMVATGGGFTAGVALVRWEAA